MENQDFDHIAARYKKNSLIQSSAADILLDLLNIRIHERVLDVGCGPGNVTRKIFAINKGPVTGIDPSVNMIHEAKKNYGDHIQFEIRSAESMMFNDEFDVIFCNSTLQWVQDIQKTLHNFHMALKKNGRVGIQSCARKDYCPNIINAIAAITKKGRLKNIYSQFVLPWLFLDTPQEYADLFATSGFRVYFSRIQTIETIHTPQEVYDIFSCGAIAGYLNRAYYKCAIDDEYIHEFQHAIKEEFVKQAEYDGKVRLLFNRIYLMGIKA